ncbi:MAG: ubiquinone biosynthesis regulatory protein kinase UbiB [Gammaproteobacteria bacterium]|nr:ubiquinone biosynthesis regulatory protein kinase UbiB [Gammaproteobacteria bacterium]
MKFITRPLLILRLFHINFILFRNRLDTFVFSAPSLQSFSFLSYFSPWYWMDKDKKSRGESLRLSLEQLGPVFVKFGQILSTRPDLIPADIVEQLEKLQDQVPPFPTEIALQILKSEYKKPIEEVFASFDPIPLASASIAQVHAATLLNGKKVVIKIVRPNIDKIIRRDIGLLYSMAALTEKFVPSGKRLRPIEVVAEVERSISYELDLLHEGANASQLRRNFLGSPVLYVPEVFWDYSSSKILVMERIVGIPISDLTQLKQHGVDLKKLAERGVEIFFTQVLRDSFFHADMHPGNIFVNKLNPLDPQYIAVDFGIMGTLSPSDQRYIAENLLAFFRRDYRRVAELHVESGWVAANVRIDEFETAVRGVCEPIFERPLKDISFGKLLLKLFQAAREFDMQVQPQFFLLQKTLLNIEGLGRQLYPELNLWTTAKPYLEKWVKQEMGPLALLQKIHRSAPQWLDKILEMPDLIHNALVVKTTPQNIERPEAILLLNRKLQKRKWLGAGIGLLTMALINYFFLHTTLSNQITVNFVVALIGAVLVLTNL